MDGRKRHKRGRMMRGEGEILGLDFVLKDCVLGEECREREGREWRGNTNLDLESVC